MKSLALAADMGRRSKSAAESSSSDECPPLCSDSSSSDSSSSDSSSSDSSSSDSSDGCGESCDERGKSCRSAVAGVAVCETWWEHQERCGKECDCARCTWMKNKKLLEGVLTFVDGAGCVGSWVEEVCAPGHPWSLRCKACHWAGETSTVLGRGTARTKAETSMDTLRRHGNNRHSQGKAGRRCAAHDRAIRQLCSAASAKANTLAEFDKDRGPGFLKELPDAPSFCHLVHFWSGVQNGESFHAFERHMKLARATGGKAPRNRNSRKMCPKLLACADAELCSEDRMLLRRAESISLTLDSRGRYVNCRMRISLREVPAGVRAERDHLGPRPRVARAAAREQAARVARAAVGRDPSERKNAKAAPKPDRRRPIRGLRGKGPYVANRLLAFWKKKPNGISEDAVASQRTILQTLRDACGDENLYNEVRKKVHCVCPDGAADVQLASRLCAEKDFENLHWVFRCAAHAAQGAVETSWGADEEVKKVDELVCSVAKFVRSSERFSDRLQELTKCDEEGEHASVKNWSFAPHRFSSKANPYARFVIFCKNVLEALAEEAERPTTRQRAAWAKRVLQAMSTEMLILSAALADLSEDALAFVREFDAEVSDPTAVARAAERFSEYLSRQYVHQRIWTEKKSYTAQLAKFFSEEHVLRFGDSVIAFGNPAPETVARAAARIANTAEAMRATLKAEFPDFATPQLVSCLQLRTNMQAEQRAQNLKLIIRQMQWPLDAEGRCLEQYRATYHEAAAKRTECKLSDIDVWAQVIADKPHNKDLNRFLMIVLSLLVTESECERNFASDNQSHSADRGNVAPTTRKHTMKVRLDGLPLYDLIEEESNSSSVTPLNNLFHCIQMRYVKKFGSKKLTTVATRCDVGKKVKKK